MITYEDIPTMAYHYRGTIELYCVVSGRVDLTTGETTEAPEWRWRCKSKNGVIVGVGEGYQRKGGALHGVDCQYGTRLAVGFSRFLNERAEQMPDPIEALLVMPWRLVILDRDGKVDEIGALY